MGSKTWAAAGFILCLICLAGANFSTLRVVGSPQTAAVQQDATDVQFITADELKTKLAKNEPVTIIDVRGSVTDDVNKIKGAIFVRLRKLKYRLGLPPLRDVPRNREVVTYCACPNDEASISAAHMLMESGFKRVRVLKGGWLTWRKINGQIEPLSKVL